MKLKKNTKKSWIKNGVLALIILTLYITGLHTEVIGFAQRGILATGLMDPDVEDITNLRNSKNSEKIIKNTDIIKADLNINLMDSQGKIVSLNELKGKVIFINFWATWCPPCIAEMPNIVKLYEEMGNEVAFIMVSFDTDFNKAKDFNKRKDYNLPIYTRTSNFPKMFQSSSLPTTYIIDANGNLVLTHKGMANYNSNEFKEFLKSLQ